MTRIGVVTEGKTDFPLLQVVLDEGLPDHAPFELVPLVPEPDATGALNLGGWRYVQAWCARKPPLQRVDEHLRPLFAGTQACRSILFMVDADIAAEVARDRGQVPALGLADRVLQLRAALRGWMSSAEPGEVDWIAVQSPETWLIAALDPTMNNPEDSPVLDVLQAAGLVQAGALRVPKDLKRHRQWARHLQGSVPHIAQRCPHLGADLARLRVSLERP